MTADGSIATQDGVTSGGPTTYVASVDLAFFKRDKDPKSSKIVQTRRKVGSSVYTTGNIWTGGKGAKWAEVDAERSTSDSGWILVEAPPDAGFRVSGPLLVDPNSETQSGSLMIRIRWNKDPPIFNCLLPKTATVGQLVANLCARTGLNKKEVVLTKGLPAKDPRGSGLLLPMDYTSHKDVLFNEQTISEAHITDTLNLVYLGHFDEDYAPN
mmetsp:Transcript_59174/g.152214  ORF Transcript_59174/g.152214 Transcript_59174/m.152214 type:complete len:212 (-) Transcript_59174:100-735(-)